MISVATASAAGVVHGLIDNENPQPTPIVIAPEMGRS